MLANDYCGHERLHARVHLSVRDKTDETGKWVNAKAHDFLEALERNDGKRALASMWQSLKGTYSLL